MLHGTSLFKRVNDQGGRMSQEQIFWKLDKTQDEDVSQFLKSDSAQKVVVLGKRKQKEALILFENNFKDKEPKKRLKTG